MLANFGRSRQRPYTYGSGRSGGGPARRQRYRSGRDRLPGGCHVRVWRGTEDEAPYSPREGHGEADSSAISLSGKTTLPPTRLGTNHKGNVSGRRQSARSSRSHASTMKASRPGRDSSGEGTA